MKKDGKFRFSLQFGSETEEDRMAGDFLEQLGNKKSAMVVAAINEYLDNHPQLRSKDYVIKIERTNYDRRKLEQIITEILDQRGSLQMRDRECDTKTCVKDICSDIEEMLSEVALFDVN